ncbi:MAG: hypothetical protein EP343_19025 [Deltaproteobacteria bacterium]|nr:MAG: hypothetical protein EP343_19025 [Deltaproteobacteria bacterium]
MKRWCWVLGVLGMCGMAWQTGYAADSNAKKEAKKASKASSKTKAPTPQKREASKARSEVPAAQPSSYGAPPAGDIYLLPWKWEKDGYALGKPKNITKRPNGYDNQPHFVDDGTSLLFASIRKKQQADLFMYDLKGGHTVQLTHTEESEFSPTMGPDKSYISTVRVAMDKTQQLWKFTHANSSLGLLLPAIRRVGYHAWFSKTELALFLVGEKGKPHTLVTTDLKTQKTRLVTKNAGRCLQPVPKTNKVSFVYKHSKDKWYIKTVEAKTGKVVTLIQTLPGQEDYAWTPRGELVMGHGPRLFLWKPGTPKTWKLIAEWKKAKFSKIQRIAISPTNSHLAFVGQ